MLGPQHTFPAGQGAPLPSTPPPEVTSAGSVKRQQTSSGVYGTKRSAKNTAAFWAQRANAAATVKKSHFEQITRTVSNKKVAVDMQPSVPARLLPQEQHRACGLAPDIQHHLMQTYLGCQEGLTQEYLPAFVVGLGLQISPGFDLDGFFTGRGVVPSPDRIVQPDELLALAEVLIMDITEQSSAAGLGGVLDELEDKLGQPGDGESPAEYNLGYNTTTSTAVSIEKEPHSGGVNKVALAARLQAAFGEGNFRNAAQATETLLHELERQQSPKRTATSPLRSFFVGSDEPRSPQNGGNMFHNLTLRAFRTIAEDEDTEEECLEITVDDILRVCEVYYTDHRDHHTTTPKGGPSLPPQLLAGRVARLAEQQRIEAVRSANSSPTTRSPSSRLPGTPNVVEGGGSASTPMGTNPGSPTTSRKARFPLLPVTSESFQSARIAPAAWDVYKRAVASAIVDRLSNTPSGTTTSMDLLTFQENLQADLNDLSSFLVERGGAVNGQHERDDGGEVVRLPQDHGLVIAELAAHVFPFCIQRLCGKNVLMALRQIQAINPHEPLSSLITRRDGPKKIKMKTLSGRHLRKKSVLDKAIGASRPNDDVKAIQDTIARAQDIQEKLLADLASGSHNVWARDAQGNVSARIHLSHSNSQSLRGGDGTALDPSFEGIGEKGSSRNQPHYLTPRGRDQTNEIHLAQMERVAFRKQILNQARERRRFELETPSPRHRETPPHLHDDDLSLEQQQVSTSSPSRPTTRPQLLALMGTHNSNFKQPSIPTPPKEIVDGYQPTTIRSPRLPLSEDAKTHAASRLSCRPGSSGRPTSTISPEEAEARKDLGKGERPYSGSIPRMGTMLRYVQYPPIPPRRPTPSGSSRPGTARSSTTIVPPLFKYQHLIDPRPAASPSTSSASPKKRKVKRRHSLTGANKAASSSCNGVATAHDDGEEASYHQAASENAPLPQVDGTQQELAV